MKNVKLLTFKKLVQLTTFLQFSVNLVQSKSFLCGQKYPLNQVPNFEKKKQKQFQKT